MFIDNLAIASDNPEAINRLLINKHSFKIKGNRSMDFYFESNFIRDTCEVLFSSDK